MNAWVGAVICIAVTFALPIFADEPASTQPVDVQIWEKDYAPTHDQRMQWWRAARFGMFIHWGVYSVPGGVWNGKPAEGAGEWIMNTQKIPVARYAELPKQFNPIKFNADEWVSIAKNAGMKYIVITSKHHDGFAMFHSHVDGYNIYDATPFKRDPLAELAEACKKQGIKLGFYYSEAQDWHHPGGAAAGGHWDPAQDGSMDDYIDKVDIPQVKELLTNYGDVAVLWWDTPMNMTPERAAKLLPLLKMQPAIVMNNRLSADKQTGDFSTPEQFIPDTGMKSDWETCMTINDTWGYKSTDTNFKSAEQLIRNLIDIASKGGNYLLNVGPTSEGLIPQPEVDRLAAIGKWMKVNGDAIYGTTASPIAAPKWGRITSKTTADGKMLYLHVFDWPADGSLHVAGIKDKIESATLLADGTKLDVIGDGTTDPNAVIIKLPATAPDSISSTIVLKLASE